jgi:hypothetical protein
MTIVAQLNFRCFRGKNIYPGIVPDARDRVKAKTHISIPGTEPRVRYRSKPRPLPLESHYEGISTTLEHDMGVSYL